jgi:hypothetical protein
LEDLGPLFVHPYQPDQFWILILIVSLPAIAASLYVLIRGQLPAALSSSFMILLPLVAYLLGDIHLMDESKRVNYCGSCHEAMSPMFETMHNDDSTLAGFHYKRGAISHQTACYSCHSGYGLSGDMTAKLAGMRHMLQTALGSEDYPLRLRRPFDIDSCLDCHAEAKPFRAIEDHRELDIQEALLAREMGCAGECHETAHPEEARHGAAAFAEAR